MASLGSAELSAAPSPHSSTVALMPASGGSLGTLTEIATGTGGETFEPKRFLCVSPGVWVPIQ
jgi:hypothetical protein